MLKDIITHPVEIYYIVRMTLNKNKKDFLIDEDQWCIWDTLY